MKRLFFCIATVFFFWSGTANAQMDPESYFGFQLGADFKLADWQQIIEYFQLLDDQSDRIQVQELGKTTNGNPFIMAIISSEQNMKKLEEYKNISRQVSKGQGNLQNLLENGKTVAMITCSIHATEVGAAQASPELAYKLITLKDPRAEKILDKVIFLLVPSFNPDGLIMVKGWYDKYVQTPFEASRMPWLYHKYTGHDNNRDSFMLTQVESQMVNDVLYHQWFPQIYMDMHQMGNRSARIFLPPFADPVNPNLDPLVIKQNSLIGEYMTTDLQAKGFKGAVSRAMFTHWWQGGFLRTAWFHNMVGILSETASANLASPIFQQKSDLRLDAQAANKFGATVSFPDPWTGGWWRLRNIVEYDLETALAFLNFGATFRDDYIRNTYQMAKRAVQKGKQEPPLAFVLPAEQWDQNAAYHLMEILQKSGIEIHQALSDFEADGRTFAKGSYVILAAQPYRAYIKDLLSPQNYPDIRAYEKGPPKPPYDNAGWTLSYQMGVEALEIVHPFQAELAPVKQIELPVNTNLRSSSSGYFLDCRLTDSFKAVNNALKNGLTVYRTEEEFKLADQTYPPGGFVFSGANSVVQKIAEEEKLIFIPLKQKPNKLKRLQAVRLGVYQPWFANVPEGWSRWVLEHFGFDYQTIHNEEIRFGDLNKKFDVIYLPDIRAEGIFEGRPEGTTPPEFSGGIETEGLAHLHDFVKANGVLITVGSSAELLLGEFGLPVEDVVKDVKIEDFFCPGSILRVDYNPKHPLCYGMNAESMAFFSRSPVFKTVPSFDTKAEIVAKYPKSDLLKSGYINNESKIVKQAAVVDVLLEKGHVVLIGFDPINRGQSHNTFKVFFNAIYYGGLMK